MALDRAGDVYVTSEGMYGRVVELPPGSSNSTEQKWHPPTPRHESRTRLSDSEINGQHGKVGMHQAHARSQWSEHPILAASFARCVFGNQQGRPGPFATERRSLDCLLYTSDAADE